MADPLLDLIPDAVDEVDPLLDLIPDSSDEPALSDQLLGAVAQNKHYIVPGVKAQSQEAIDASVEIAARELRLPPQEVANNYHLIKQARLDDISPEQAAELADSSPELARFFIDNPGSIPAEKAEIGRMGVIDQTLQSLKGGTVSGMLTSEKADIQYNRVKNGFYTAEEFARLEQIDQELERKNRYTMSLPAEIAKVSAETLPITGRILAHGVLGTGIGTGAGTAAAMLAAPSVIGTGIAAAPALAAGAAVGSAVGIIASWAEANRINIGLEYDRLSKAGIDDDVAIPLARLSAGAQAALDIVSLKAIGKTVTSPLSSAISKSAIVGDAIKRSVAAASAPVRHAINFAGTTVGAIAAEAPTEGAQGGISSLTDYAARQYRDGKWTSDTSGSEIAADLLSHMSTDSFKEEVIANAKAGAEAAVGLGVIGGAYGFSSRYRQASAKKAALKSVIESNYDALAREQFDFESHNSPPVSIPISEFNRVIGEGARQSYIEATGGAGEVFYDQAAATGGSLPMTYNSFKNAFKGSPGFDELLNSVRIGGSSSINESLINAVELTEKTSNPTNGREFIEAVMDSEGFSISDSPLYKEAIVDAERSIGESAPATEISQQELEGKVIDEMHNEKYVQALKDGLPGVRESDIIDAADRSPIFALNPSEVLKDERATAAMIRNAIKDGAPDETVTSLKERRAKLSILYREARSAVQAAEEVSSKLTSSEWISQFDRSNGTNIVADALIGGKDKLEALSKMDYFDGASVIGTEGAIESELPVNLSKMTYGEVKSLSQSLKTMESVNKALKDGIASDSGAIVSDVAPLVAQYIVENNAPLAAKKRKQKRSKFDPRGLYQIQRKAVEEIETLGFGREEANVLRDNTSGVYARAARNAIRLEEKVTGILDSTSKLFSSKEVASWYDKSFSVDGIDYSIAEAIAMAAHSSSNMNYLVNGNGLSAEHIGKVIGHLNDKRYAKVVQSILDAFGSVTEDVNKLSLDVFGRPIKLVESNPIRIAGEEIKGGYLPAVASEEYLNDKSTTRGLQYGERNALSVMAPWVKDRTGAAYPLSLDLGFVPGRLSDVIHEVTHRRAAMHVHGVLSNPSVRDAIVSRAGDSAYKNIIDWSRSVASNGRSDAKLHEAVEAFSGWATSKTQTAILGYKVSTIVAQLLDAPKLTQVLGTKWSSSGFMDTIGKTREDGIRGFTENLMLSPVLRKRLEATADTTINDQYNKLSTLFRGEKPSPKREAATKAAIWAIAKSDGIVASIYWRGAFNQAMAGAVSRVEAGNVKESVAYADQVISENMGDPSLLYRSAVQRGSNLTKMLTIFGTFANANTNQIITNFKLASKRRKLRGDYSGYKKALGYLIVGTMVPAVLRKMMFRRPGDDEDILYTAAKSPLQDVFFAREILSATEKGLGISGFSGRPLPIVDIPATAITGSYKLLKYGAKTINKGEFQKLKKKDAREIALFVSLAMNMPLSNQVVDTVFGANAVLSGKAEDPWDAIRLLEYGGK